MTLKVSLWECFLRYRSVSFDQCICLWPRWKTPQKNSVTKGKRGTGASTAAKGLPTVGTPRHPTMCKPACQCRGKPSPPWDAPGTAPSQVLLEGLEKTGMDKGFETFWRSWRWWRNKGGYRMQWCLKPVSNIWVPQGWSLNLSQCV